MESYVWESFFKAVDLLRKAKGIDFIDIKLTDVDATYVDLNSLFSSTKMVKTSREDSIRIEATAKPIAQGSYATTYELEYLVPKSDLMDGSKIDGLVGFDIDKLKDEDKAAVRAAFILYEGLAKALGWNQRKDDGWPGRLTKCDVEAVY